MNPVRRRYQQQIQQNNRDRVTPYPAEIFGYAVDGTPLVWYVIAPDYTLFPPPRPTALFTHVGGFKNGSALEGNLLEAAVDCAANGILGLSVQYRMDKQLVPGQPAPVFWPCEADDLKQAVVAARLAATPLTEGKVDPTNVFGVGGSTGADLTVHACCDTEGNVSGFNNWTRDDQLKFAVLFSGPYKFEDRTADPYLKPFVANVNLYSESKDLAVQATKSSVAAITADCPPFYIVQFESDTMPRSQYNAIIAKLDSLGLTNYETLLATGFGHAFDAWPQFMAANGMDWILARINE